MDAKDSSSSKRKYVVTGAAGFLGASLVNQLTASGCDVTAVDKQPCVFTGARSVLKDLSAAGAMDSFTDPDTTVFHMAASADVPRSVQDPRYDFDNSLRTLFEILETARATGCSVIFPSTASVYDPASPLPLSERAFARPSSPYGAGKLAAESYCFAYHRAFGADVKIARLFNVYGVGMRRFVIHDIIRKLQADPQKITIRGDGHQVRDYLYIDDAIRGLRLVAAEGTPGEDYNLASGVPTTILELTERIAKLMKADELTVVTSGESFRGDTVRWYADVSKARALGFVPGVSLDDGLMRTIGWLNDEG